MLNDILILDQQWLPNQSDFPPISWPWYQAWPSPIMSGFHGAYATGAACQQGTFTLSDTWFRPPLWDLLVLQLLRPYSSNLPCLYSTFHLDYPLVLSRFYLWALNESECIHQFDIIAHKTEKWWHCLPAIILWKNYSGIRFALLQQDNATIQIS